MFVFDSSPVPRDHYRPDSDRLIVAQISGIALRHAHASKPLAESGVGPGIMTGGPGSLIADRGATAIGQVVYQQRLGVTGMPERLDDPPPLLAGREDLLAELDTRLASGDNPTPQKVALCGLGGAGKTSVALAYAHRHLAEVGVAWQFSAEVGRVEEGGAAGVDRADTSAACPHLAPISGNKGPPAPSAA